MIIFQDVSKGVLRDLSFQVNKGEILVLLGQSGCGKTTALRLINRLIEPEKGRISFEGKDSLDLDPITLRRHVGYAIQHIGLFPHMTVEENIGIVPELLGWDQNKIDERVSELLSIMGLDEKKYKTMFPQHLSGGQKQRIGVARALAADPPIILMDEPFGALDPLLRQQLQNEFLEIQSKIRKTIVFVTHDLSEAVKMGDRIAVLDKGRLVQISTPQELVNNPANTFVEDFLGSDKIRLILQVHSIGSFLSKLSSEKINAPRLNLKSSLMDAMSLFQLEKNDALAIYDGDDYVGQLKKKELLETLLNHL